MSAQLLGTPAGPSEVPERFDPATMRGEIIEAEHVARYRWVSSIAAGRRVLDAGCGTAYGSVLLAEAGALEVVGVDCASDVLDSARAQVPTGVILKEGDVTALSFEDGRFDLIVCFEVIEHLSDPGRALDEFRRLISQGGVLAVSSPNRETYPPGNPHHVREYVPAELEQELSCRFPAVRLERQHTWITSGVLDNERFRTGEDAQLGPDVHVRKLSRGELGTELYTVALAGQEELPNLTPTLELAAPVELRKWDALWHEQNQDFGRQAEVLSDQSKMLEEQAALLSDQARALGDDVAYKASLKGEIMALRDQLASAEAELARLPGLEAQAGELVRLNDDLVRELAERQRALDELGAIAEQYTVVIESTSWKVTRPLRNAVGLVRSLIR